DILHVEGGNLGREAEQRALRHQFGKRGARLDHGAGGLDLDTEDDARLRRSDLDAVQRILGNLNLLVETRDLAADIGEIPARVLAQLLRGVEDLLAHLRDGLGEAGDFARDAADLAFEPGPLALVLAQFVAGIIAALRGTGDDADLLHDAG